MISSRASGATAPRRFAGRSLLSVVRRSPRLVLPALGGWSGVLALAVLSGASAALFVMRGHLGELGHLGYVGVALIAFFGNAPLVPVFPWLFIVAPLSGVYPMGGLVAAGAIGAGLGEMVPYFWGTRLHQAHKDHPWVAKLAGLPAWMRVSGVFLLSLSPAFSFPGLASGVLRVPWWAMLVMKVTTEALKLWLVLQGVAIARDLLGG